MRLEREPRGDGVRWNGPAACDTAERSSRALLNTGPSQLSPVTPE